MAWTLKYRNPLATNSKYLIASGNYNIIWWNLFPQGSSSAFLKIYNAATLADVTIGTTTPVKTLFIPGGGTAFLSNEGEINENCPRGIVVTVTANGTDTDNTAPSNTCYVEIGYAANQ